MTVSQTQQSGGLQRPDLHTGAVGSMLQLGAWLARPPWTAAYNWDTPNAAFHPATLCPTSGSIRQSRQKRLWERGLVSIGAVLYPSDDSCLAEPMVQNTNGVTEGLTLAVGVGGEMSVVVCQQRGGRVTRTDEDIY